MSGTPGDGVFIKRLVMTSYLLAFTAAASAYNLQLHPTPRTASVARTVPVVAKLAETDQSNWCTDVEGADGLTVVFFCARLELELLLPGCKR